VFANVTVDANTGLATGPVSSSSSSFAELVRGETSAFSVPAPDARAPGSGQPELRANRVVTGERESPVIPRFSTGPAHPVPFLQPCGNRPSDRD